MKNKFRSRSLKRSIMSLFTPQKTTDAHKRFPDAYYRRIYFTKPLFEGIDFLAKVERKSKKQMAHELMELGISSFMGEKIREYNKRVIAAQRQSKVIGII